jgi:signal transduction histidine kinase
MMILRILPKIAMALQILKFNQSLQAEVKRKTHSLDEKNRELKDAYEKLKEIDNNKDNFLAIASHELRTPMTIIKGYADLFLQNTLGPMTENQSRYMKKIFESTE